VDHAGLLLGQPQPPGGQRGGRFLAQCLGVAALPGDHDDEVVGLCRALDYAGLPVTVLASAAVAAACSA